LWRLNATIVEPCPSPSARRPTPTENLIAAVSRGIEVLLERRLAGAFAARRLGRLHFDALRFEPPSECSDGERQRLRPNPCRQHDGLAFCAVVVGPEGDSKPATPAPRYDLSAQYACEQFWELTHDIRVGIVTDAERRARVVTLYQKARFANPAVAPKVAVSAERLLAELTTGTDQDVSAAARQLDDACNSYIRASRESTR
jgi:hypothetical protein